MKLGFAYALIIIGVLLIVVLTPFAPASAVVESMHLWWIAGSALIIFGILKVRKLKRESRGN